jgi:release factor glutamine methyltransferase
MDDMSIYPAEGAATAGAGDAGDAGDAGVGIVARLRAAGCVFAEDEARLLRATARDEAELDAMTARRVAGLPLEQVLGWAEFGGLRIAVDPGVFVPRRRTEFLVEQAVLLVEEAVSLSGKAAVAVDLCCGSGAIGAALAARVELAGLHAADLDPVAVRCARRNLEPLGGLVYLGDLFEPLPAELAGLTDVITANVPYVPSGEVGLLPAEARLHEARIALDGGEDGLAVARRVAAGAADWLAPGGHLLIEVSDRQAPAAVAAFAAAGLSPRLVSSEESAATVVIGAQPG